MAMTGCDFTNAIEIADLAHLLTLSSKAIKRIANLPVSCKSLKREEVPDVSPYKPPFFGRAPLDVRNHRRSWLLPPGSRRDLAGWSSNRTKCTLGQVHCVRVVLSFWVMFGWVS